jgi:autotransporter-associated beta strand protein
MKLHLNRHNWQTTWSTGSKIQLTSKALLALAAIVPTTAVANMFYFETYVIFDAGSGASYYDLSATTGNPNWQGASFSYNLLEPSTLNIKGAQFKAYRDTDTNYWNTNNTQTLRYSVYPNGGAPTFSSYQLLAGGTGGTTSYLGGSDFQAQNTTGNVSLESLISESGSYNIAMYAEGNASFGSQSYFPMSAANNGGNNYVANVAAFYGATGAGTQSTVFSGTGNFSKSGSGVYVLDQANTYSGSTTISGGSLLINGSTASTSAVTAAAVTTLGGSGNIGGSTEISGIHAPGNVAVGQQSFGSNLTYVEDSLFEWELNAGTTDPGAGTNNSGAYDKVVASGAVTGSSTFSISSLGNSFTEAFWDTNKSWSDIFTAGLGSQPLQSIFSTFSGTNVSTTGLVTNQGQFSFSGNTLNWTAVPEPSSALAGLLVAAGMMRRRRPM